MPAAAEGTCGGAVWVDDDAKPGWTEIRLEGEIYPPMATMLENLLVTAPADGKSALKHGFQNSTRRAATTKMQAAVSSASTMAPNLS